jgi:hypothetical protein
VAGLVEPVGVPVVRPGEAELPRLAVHQPDEARLASGGGHSERGGRVVRARHERPYEEVADGHPLPGLEVERRLADPRRDRRHGHDVVQGEMLERDERGHQLRDARHRPRRVGGTRGERVAVDGALDDVRAGLDSRRGCPLGRCAHEECGGRDGETEAHHAGKA